jgi:drug/metabolite transporter (DMT)-like permease
VDPLVIGLVAVSAVLHVAWNVRLKTAGDPLHAATIGQLAAAGVIVPLGALWWWFGGAVTLPVEGLGLGVASGTVEAVYFILLSAAYRRGDLSVVYPIARGTAPLVAVFIGVVVLGERLGVVGYAGVAALLGGFLWHQRPWRVLGVALGAAGRGSAARGSAPGSAAARPPDTAIAFAVATGLAIASYSAIDRVGSRLIEPITYAGILWATCSVVLLGWNAVVGERGVWSFRAEAWRPAAVGGLLSLVAYVMILFALSVSPLTAVAPLRESSIVLASAWGAVRLREASGAGEAFRRVAASALIVLGAVLLAFG